MHNPTKHPALQKAHALNDGFTLFAIFNKFPPPKTHDIKHLRKMAQLDNPNEFRYKVLDDPTFIKSLMELSDVTNKAKYKKTLRKDDEFFNEEIEKYFDGFDIEKCDIEAEKYYDKIDAYLQSIGYLND